MSESGRIPRILAALPSAPHASLWVVGLMWTLPFFNPYHRYPSTNFYTEWSAVIFGLLALTLFVRASRWRNLELPRIALLPLGLIILLLLQIGTNHVVYHEQNILAAAYLLWAVFLMLLGHVLVRELGWEKTVSTLAGFLVLSGVLNATIALVQHYHIPVLFDNLIMVKMRLQAFANMGQRNHFSDYISLGLASLLYLLSGRQVRLRFALPIAGGLLFVLALAGSRASWVYLVLFAVLAAGFYWRRRDARSRQMLLGAFLLLPAFVLAQYLVNAPWLAVASGRVVTPADNLFALAQGQSDRLPLLWESWQMFLKAPLTGVGFSQFGWHHFLFAADLPSHMRGALYSHSHNLFTHLLAEMGFPAILLLLGSGGLWLFTLLRGELTPERWWVLALLGVIGMHSMVEYPLWYANFLGIFAVLLGLGETHTVKFSANLRRFGRWGFVLMLVLAWVSVVNIGRSYRDLEELLYLRGKKFVLHDEADARRFHESLLKIHQDSLLAPYIELAYSNTIILDNDHIDDKLSLNTRVMRFAPVPNVVFRQPILLALRGDLEAARTQFGYAVTSNPVYLKPILHLLKKHANPAFDGMIALGEQKLKESDVAASQPPAK